MAIVALNSNSGTGTSGDRVISISIAGGSGSCILVGLSINAGSTLNTPAHITITDDGGNTYSQVDNRGDFLGAQGALWKCLNGNAATQVTVHLDSTYTNFAAGVVEYDNVLNTGTINDGADIGITNPGEGIGSVTDPTHWIVTLLTTTGSPSVSINGPSNLRTLQNTGVVHSMGDTVGGHGNTWTLGAAQNCTEISVELIPQINQDIQMFDLTPGTCIAFDPV